MFHNAVPIPEDKREQAGGASSADVAQGGLQEERRAEAALLVRRPHLPGHARRRQEDDPQPDLPLDQGQLCLLQNGRQELAGELPVLISTSGRARLEPKMRLGTARAAYNKG